MRASRRAAQALPRRPAELSPVSSPATPLDLGRFDLDARADLYRPLPDGRGSECVCPPARLSEDARPAAGFLRRTVEEATGDGLGGLAPGARQTHPGWIRPGTRWG